MSSILSAFRTTDVVNTERFYENEMLLSSILSAFRTTDVVNTERFYENEMLFSLRERTKLNNSFGFAYIKRFLLRESNIPRLPNNVTSMTVFYNVH